MGTTEDIIGDALAGVELVRNGLPVLAALDPAIAAIAGPALTLVYEGLVALRDEAARMTPEEIRAKLRAAIDGTIQELARARFDNVPAVVP